MERSGEQAARADALLALTDDHRKILVAEAKLRARGTSHEFGDLLHGAYERWLASGKDVGTPAETFMFLRGAIRSIAYNDRRHSAMIRRLEGERSVAAEGEPDPMESVPDPTASQGGTVLLGELYDLCAHDPDVQSLVAYQIEPVERAQILSELGWDVTKYETVQKRKKRILARLMSEGKI